LHYWTVSTYEQAILGLRIPSMIRPVIFLNFKS